MSKSCILVPVDSTEQSIVGLSQSYNIAKLTASRIVILTFDDGKPEEAKQRMEKLAAEARKQSGVLVETIIKKGSTKEAYDEINKTADELQPLFIVMGLVSKFTLKNIIGKNVFRMVRECNYPVITIKGKFHRNGCKNILLPLDLSKESRQKVGKAIDLAKMFGSNIRAVSILTTSDEIFENKLISYGNQAWKLIKEQGVASSIKTLRGKNIPKMVIDYAHEIEADLIMIMSEDHETFAQVLLGTNAQHIISKCDIPVLSLRPKMLKDTSTFAMPY